MIYADLTRLLIRLRYVVNYVAIYDHSRVVDYVKTKEMIRLIEQAVERKWENEIQKETYSD